MRTDWHWRVWRSVHRAKPYNNWHLHDHTAINIHCKLMTDEYVACTAFLLVQNLITFSTSTHRWVMSMQKVCRDGIATASPSPSPIAGEVGFPPNHVKIINQSCWGWLQRLWWQADRVTESCDHHGTEMDGQPNVRSGLCPCRCPHLRSGPLIMLWSGAFLANQPANDLQNIYLQSPRHQNWQWKLKAYMSLRPKWKWWFPFEHASECSQFIRRISSNPPNAAHDHH
jgi:hypothetical protein